MGRRGGGCALHFWREIEPVAGRTTYCDLEVLEVHTWRGEGADIVLSLSCLFEWPLNYLSRISGAGQMHGPAAPEWPLGTIQIISAHMVRHDEPPRRHARWPSQDSKSDGLYPVSTALVCSHRHVRDTKSR